MARLIALEWDADEARVLLATSRGSGLTLESAFDVQLPAHPGKTETDHVAAGEAIRAALQRRSVGKADCVVAVGRASIELKYLSLPPAPDEELPDLVRFQAMREFNAIGEDWPLDFLPLDNDPTQPRNVLAAAIAPQLIEQIRSACQVAGLEAQRVILRPCAVASLLRRHRPVSGEQIRLLVDLLATEVDLTVMRGDSIVFLRTARIAAESHSPEASRPLILEIRRTLAAVSQRLAGQRVEAIYVCGDGEPHRALATQIQKELELPAHLFDPFETVQLSNEFRGSPPAHPGRYAPLVGMLVDEAQGSVHALDFLHPRQKPKPPSRRNKYGIAAGTAAAVVALAAFGIWLHASSLDGEIQTLADTSKSLDGELKRLQESQKAVDDIDKWAATDVVWLDELHELAQELPDSKELKLTSVVASSTTAGSNVELQGMAKTGLTVNSLDAKLNDDRHRFVLGSIQQDEKNPSYPQTFKSSVIVQRDVPFSPATAKSSKPETDKTADRPAGEGSK